MIYKILLIIIYSQIFYLGVFSQSNGGIYVVNQKENLCGEFFKGNSDNPNWLQNGWIAINQDSSIELDFLSNSDCEKNSVEKCCKSLGYRYAGVPIGVQYISIERKGAEFLAGKNIIESHSFYAQKYNLEDFISRKEVMKVIIKASNLEIKTICKNIFTDVKNDWGCKYIELALENEYITGNEKFRPDSKLTKTEALKLIFKVRNIEKSYETNSWQEDYISTALYLGYIDEKFSNYNEIASRGWIFSVLAKTYPEFKNY